MSTEKDMRLAALYGNVAAQSMTALLQTDAKVDLPAAFAVDFREVEQRVAVAMVEGKVTYSKPCSADRFPDTGATAESPGRYGMFRTHEGHALAVKRCLRALRPIRGEFDAIYCTGLSGEIPAATVTYVMKKELLVLRKQRGSDTMSHGQLLEGSVKDVSGTRYIIIDDFVSGGGTLKRLMQHLPSNGSLVGVLLYGHPVSPNERDHGAPATQINIAKDGDSATVRERLWFNLVRRGRNSMMFDLVPSDT